MIFGEDVFGGLGPDKGSGVLIAAIEIGVDLPRGLRFPDGFAPDADTAHDHTLAAMAMGEEFAIRSLDHPIPFDFSPELITS